MLLIWVMMAVSGAASAAAARAWPPASSVQSASVAARRHGSAMSAAMSCWMPLGHAAANSSARLDRECQPTSRM